MSAPAPTDAALDQQLRRLFAALDTGPDFGVRLAARVAAARAVPDPATRARQRAAAEAARAQVALALRRRLWIGVAVVALAGVAGLALAPYLQLPTERAFTLLAERGGRASLVLMPVVGLALPAWLAFRHGLGEIFPRLGLRPG